MVVAPISNVRHEDRLTEYQKFLESKRVLAPACGFDVPANEINPMLFPFQSDICRWALRRGKAAVFAATGLGKGPIQLSWCEQVYRHTGRNTLIVAPLAVAQQFKLESEKFHTPVKACRDQSEVEPGISVTNYDRVDRFDLSTFAGVSLDESAAIKDFTSKTFLDLLERLRKTPFKLCCTATPAPNDHAELGTHAEILDVMERSQMLAMFFEHDGGQTSKWVLKGHARKPFWQFMASWAICVNLPSDLGYEDAGFLLPQLNMQVHEVDVDHITNEDGTLFRIPDMSATGLHRELRLTVHERAAKVAQLVSVLPDVPWLIWCNTDYEAAALRAVVPGIVEVRGSDTPEIKEDRLIGFATGKYLRLLTKPGIAGRGMNYQHCWNMASFLSYSFEDLFQLVRRCWRYGQTHEVNAHVVVSETEGPIVATIRRKQQQFEEMQSEMVAAMREEQLEARGVRQKYLHEQEIQIPSWLHSL